MYVYDLSALKYMYICMYTCLIVGITLFLAASRAVCLLDASGFKATQFLTLELLSDSVCMKWEFDQQHRHILCSS